MLSILLDPQREPTGLLFYKDSRFVNGKWNLFLKKSLTSRVYKNLFTDTEKLKQYRHKVHITFLIEKNKFKKMTNMMFLNFNLLNERILSISKYCDGNLFIYYEKHLCSRSSGISWMDCNKFEVNIENIM